MAKDLKKRIGNLLLSCHRSGSEMILKGAIEDDFGAFMKGEGILACVQFLSEQLLEDIPEAKQLKELREKAKKLCGVLHAQGEEDLNEQLSKCFRLSTGN